MAKYRAAIIGCGPRARDHAGAYLKLQDEGLVELVAGCDLDAGRLKGFCEEFKIANRYRSVEQFLALEVPDVVSIVTNPLVRRQPVLAAAGAGVRGIVLEKAMATTPSEAKAIAEACRAHGTKLVVNHQLRFMPEWQRLQAALAGGELGEVYFLRATCKGNLLEQGTHLVDMLLMLTGDQEPEWVMGQVDDLQGFTKTHPCPDFAVGEIKFRNGLRAFLECGPGAADYPEEPSFWFSFAIEAYGSEGRARALLNNGCQVQKPGLEIWETLRAGWDSIGPQADLVRSLLTWLEDDARPAPTNLDTSLISFDVVMAICESARRGGRVAFPVELTDECVNAFRSRAGT